MTALSVALPRRSLLLGAAGNAGLRPACVRAAAGTTLRFVRRSRTWSCSTPS